MIDRDELEQKIYEFGNYAKVAKHFGVTRERIRQLGNKLGIDIMALRYSNPAKYLTPPKMYEVECKSCKGAFVSHNKKAKFCSKKCMGVYMKQRYTFNVLNRKDSSGKRYKYVGKRVSKDGISYPENKILARTLTEAYIGRKLKSFECIHHIDGDVTNNNLENLVIMRLGEHSSLHNTFSRRSELISLKSNLKEEKRKVERIRHESLERRI